MSFRRGMLRTLRKIGFRQNFLKSVQKNMIPDEWKSPSSEMFF